jgi:putative lipoprotein
VRLIADGRWLIANAPGQREGGQSLFRFRLRQVTAYRRFVSWLWRVVVLSVVLLTAVPAWADDWWGPDKGLHFSVSVGLAAGGYGVSALALQRRWQRAVVGGATSLTLGAAKETCDAVGPGDASGRDLVWDAAGTAVGLGLALSIDALVRREPRDRREAAFGSVVPNSRMDW